MPLVEYIGDAVLDIEVTPNRADCLSILGIAHEVAALTGAAVTEPDLSYPESDAHIETQAKVEIADPDLCFRYTATLIHDIEIAESPQWMQDALTKAGLRPINNIVDITNLCHARIRTAAPRLRLRQSKGQHNHRPRSTQDETLETLRRRDPRSPTPHALHRRHAGRHRTRRRNGRREHRD